MQVINKHIAVVCNYQLKDNRIGSMDRFFLAFDKQLKKEGYQVDWFFFKSKSIEFYKDVNLYSDEYLNVETLFTNHTQLKNVNYDYVFTHFIELFTPFYKKVKQYTNCKIIAVDHMSRPIDGFTFKKRIKIKVKYLFYSKYIDTVVAVSNYIKRQNLKDYNKNLAPKIEIIYNGIQSELYKKKVLINYSPNYRFKFIVVAHLVYEKGIQDLINAVEDLEGFLKSKLEIDIYGEGIYKAELIELIQKKGLDVYFNFKGSVSNLQDLYASYDYLILPSYMEAFSLTILESLLANVPVITTSVGGNCEVVENDVNGFMFPVGDVAAIKEILESILKGEKTIPNDVFARIEKEFYLKKMVNDYLKLIENHPS